jgi:hypothetical protein
LPPPPTSKDDCADFGRAQHDPKYRPAVFSRQPIPGCRAEAQNCARPAADPGRRFADDPQKSHGIQFTFYRRKFLDAPRFLETGRLNTTEGHGHSHANVCDAIASRRVPQIAEFCLCDCAGSIAPGDCLLTWRPCHPIPKAKPRSSLEAPGSCLAPYLQMDGYQAVSALTKCSHSEVSRL